MSTGFFMGIKSSYTEDAQEAASVFLEAINTALKENGLALLADPDNPPDVYEGHLFGRSELDHHSSRVLANLGALACSSRYCPNLALIRDNPFRVAFLPIDFSIPLGTGYFEQIGGERIQIWIGSLPQLQSELNACAIDLGIELNQEQLSDEVATAINQFQPLYVGDTAALAEDERTAWLALYEGTRLAMNHKVALSLAG
ncbi:hypothetical protein [Silvibacterium acidisoli]|uniref:hypothetical protein n=1 Tax=Acidobacteriaceae bacterium ZG23-2 TaxID=2883246 RepID=UPI00406C7DA1